MPPPLTDMRHHGDLAPTPPSPGFATTKPPEQPSAGQSERESDAAARDSRYPAPRARDAAPAHTHVFVDGQSFTVRGVLVGLLVGLVICFSNMYFGLQTGWVSTMTMPASLLGFGFFRALSRHLKFPFSPVENVLVQTVAGSMAIMPLGCGFVGVIPAMNYLLAPAEQGPIVLGLGKLILWSLGLCYFGVVFAVPLRRQVIIREQLKFPSGFSTAVLIGVLHGRSAAEAPSSSSASGSKNAIPAGFASLAVREQPLGTARLQGVVREGGQADEEEEEEEEIEGEAEAGGAGRDQSWRRNVRLLLVCFLVSGLFTFGTYFFPVLRSLPVFGSAAASAWLWTLNPSLAYVGQGIIMGPTTTLHMLLGALVGWAVLSPLAKFRGWAPGPVDDWEVGSKGWIVWTALAIMLADAVVSLGYIAFRPLLNRGLPIVGRVLGSRFGYASLPSHDRDEDDGHHNDSNNNNNNNNTRLRQPILRTSSGSEGDSGVDEEEEEQEDVLRKEDDNNDGTPDDAPPDQQIGDRTVAVGLVLSVVFCIFCTHMVFGDLVPLYATVASVLVALVLSIMGVRAMGETDLNPVSGISKLAQLFFALIVPQSNKSSVLINLVAGAVSEAGALQSGDMMQDLKTGHLLGASPKAQFWGQVIGATVGAVVSAFIYRLYTHVYTIPGDLFPVPTGYVWISTARLVTGKGLPPMAREWATGFAVLFVVLTMLRIYAAGRPWQALIPGGIAVAVGMYNVPSFTLARTIGGLLGWWWRSAVGWPESPLIVLASGLILGEGFLSIVNLMMQSFGVPHL